MRYREIIGPSHPNCDGEATIVEETPSGGVAPLTPAQSRAKAKRTAKATENVRDVQAANAVRMHKATRKVFQS